ncbi:MAG: hypothetical protein WC378_20955 [Opitutaceae bacterium]
MPTGAGFLLRLPEGANSDGIAYALGVELVAETQGGYMLVATEDLTFARIKEVLDAFAEEAEGGGTAAFVLEVFAGPEDMHRISRILDPEVLPLWPFVDDQVYIFDLSVQTAPSLRTVTFPRVKKSKHESPETFATRKRTIRDAILVEASDQWAEAAELRFHELVELIQHYQGILLTGMANAPEEVAESGVVFADCFQLRVRMSGRGFKDVVLNSPHLFEVALPEDIQIPGTDIAAGGGAIPNSGVRT